MLSISYMSRYINLFVLKRYYDTKPQMFHFVLKRNGIQIGGFKK